MYKYKTTLVMHATSPVERVSLTVRKTVDGNVDIILYDPQRGTVGCRLTSKEVAQLIAVIDG